MGYGPKLNQRLDNVIQRQAVPCGPYGEISSFDRLPWPPHDGHEATPAEPDTTAGSKAGASSCSEGLVDGTRQAEMVFLWLL